MTEWCYGLDVGNNAVLKNQDHYDRLPSPDTWMQWETCNGFGWANNFDFGAIENVKPQRRTLFSGNGNQEMTQFDVEQSLNTDDFGLSSEDTHSFLQNGPARVRPDYYVNDLMTGADPTDDIFLSSLFQDDVLPLQSLCIAMPYDSDSTNKMMDMQSISSDTDGMRNLKGFTNPYFSGSHASDDTSNQSSSPSEKVLEARDEAPSDHKIARKTTEVNNLSSIEESVLTGLENVLNQLNDETRLCLRDSMYRLARHSEEQTSKNEGQFSDEPSFPESSDVCSRSSTMETTESETNAVDRAVAYMMFNNVDGNRQDHIPASPPDYVHNDGEFTAIGGSGFNEGLCYSPSDTLVQCEVPVLSQQAQS